MSEYTNASIILPQCPGYKANKLYCLKPTDGSADLTSSRASAASRIDKNGNQEVVATGIPRIDYTNGVGELLLEPARKNLFLNSATGVTQSITVVSGRDYAVSFSGTGTITFSGGATGSLVGTGASATDRVSTIITTSTTSVTCTITGTVEYVNFEINTDDSSVSYATSWIETTGTTVTRIADAVSGATGLGSVINSSEGVLYFEGSAFEFNASASNQISLSDGTSNNRVMVFPVSQTQLGLRFNGNGVQDVAQTVTVSNLSNNSKIAISWDGLNYKLWQNGIEIYTQSISNIPIGMDKFSFNDVGTSNPFYGRIRDLRVYNTALTDAELQTLTTL